MSTKQPVKHLLKPKEFRVWCLPDRVPGVKMSVTNEPSKADCSNCLTKWRTKTTGKKGTFKLLFTNREREEHVSPVACGVCGLAITRADSLCGHCGATGIEP